MAVSRDQSQKNPRVRKIRVRNSGAGNGCANFMDTWKKCLLSAGKTMSVKFPFFGGGFFGGGGSADFIFMGARIFLTKGRASISSQRAWRGISMSRGKNCRETIFAAQLPRNDPHRGGNFERGKKSPLLWGRGNLGDILRDNLGEGNCKSKIAARQWGVNFAARHQDVSQGPLG